MDATKHKAIVKAVRNLKAKGVTAIKLELEAHMGRRRDYDEQCATCEGDGWDPENRDEECSTCNGSGDYQASPDTVGFNFAREADCMRWLLTRIAEKTGSVRTGYANDETSEDEDEASESYYNPFPWMKFARFYNDGSVDSELTFTISIDDEANVLYLPKVVEAFKELGQAVGQEFTVTGAGMHTALLFSEDCSYPTDDADEEGYGSRLPEQNLTNFRRSMLQLLPALFFLASTNENSRGLRYRLPNVSVNHNYEYRTNGNEPKYNAITYRYGAFEFRIFDTCYDTPDVVLDNIVVIANCMKYLSPQYLSPGIDTAYSEIRFGTDYNNKLDRFYGTVSHLDVLKAGLTKIKPSYYSLTELKKQRNFKRTKATLKSLRTRHEKQARIEYEEYAERFDWQMKYREKQLKAELIRNTLDTIQGEELRTLTEETLEARVADQLKTYVRRFKNDKQEATNYISSRLNTFDRSNRGEYTLAFTS